MICFLIAILNNDNLDTFITIARGFYGLLAIWYVYLGIGLVNKPDPDLCNRHNQRLVGGCPKFGTATAGFYRNGTLLEIVSVAVDTPSKYNRMARRTLFTVKLDGGPATRD